VHKEFAVKVLLTEIAEHHSIAQRFFLEAQAAGRIGHPGILDVYDVGEDDKGVPFIVMELLKGEPLAALLKRHRPSAETACWIAEQVLEILAAAHKANVIHRDVKPQNVFLCEAPGSTRTVKLLDFGIAKFAAGPDASAITRSGEIIGSPLYMAPEQAKGEVDVVARADVWSVGAMLFEMLTGKAAHSAPTPVAVLAKILTEPAPPPSERSETSPAELDAIVQKALSIDRAARFADARAMLDALRAVRKELGWSTAAPTFPAVEPIRLDSDSKTQSGSVTSTIEAPSRPNPPASAEPSLEAAVTNDGARSTRSGRPWAMIAVAVLGVAVAIPFVMSSSQKQTVPSATPVAATSLAPPAVVESVSLPIPPPAESASAPTASASASAPPKPSTTPAAIAKPAAPPPTSKPQCAATEVLSNGHCCPRGLVWQDGRCERPLATSF
jgi:serine/threonine protein kinase